MMNQLEFDLFMAKALAVAGEVNRLQSVKIDAMAKAGAESDMYGCVTDEAGMLKMAIAGTDEDYERADFGIKSLYDEIEKAGIAPAVSDVNDFSTCYFSNETRLPTLNERNPLASRS